MMTQLNQLCSMTMYVSPTFTRHFKREIQVELQKRSPFKSGMWYPEGISVCGRGKITALQFTSIAAKIKWIVISIWV